MPSSRSDLDPIYAYHDASKHRPDRYAPGPGGLDWANQPDPFRTFEGAEMIDLPLTADTLATPFAEIRRGMRPEPRPLGLEPLAALLELSFGLSAWKEYQASRWALRCNPSSGNLHPTECYLVTAAVPGLRAGVYHYVSRDHRLEQCASSASPAWGQELAEGVLVGLSAVHWREAWKYGLRAYRYCQHDCGHGIGALAYAAAALGWRVRVLSGAGDAETAALLGLDRSSDLVAEEPEVAEVLLWVGPAEPPRLDSGTASSIPLPERSVAELRRHGRANRLSAEHRDWPGIETVHQAALRPAGTHPETAGHPDLPPLAESACGLTAATLIRQRRSAVAFDAHTVLPAERWIAMLDALLPRPDVPPLDAWPAAPRVHPVLFVHRVADMAPGIYVLARDAQALPRLREALRPDWSWQRVDQAPAHMELYRLVAGDARDAAGYIACHQDIAADSCFSLGMLSDFDAALKTGPWAYRELYRECGLLGQILYLEAEAAGVRATGIGCFFDDTMHELLGIGDTEWQSLYHFTVGGPVPDSRLRTHPPYAHLQGRPRYGAGDGRQGAEQ